MSLINDALKRARETEQPRAGEPPPPLQPVDYAARPHRAAWMILIVLLVATLGFAAFYLSRWAGSSGAGRAGGTSNEAVAASLASPEEVAAPAVRPAIKVTTNLMARQASAPRSTPSASTATPPSAAPEPGAAIPDRVQPERPGFPGGHAPATVQPVAQVEARFPELKLQSIVFRLRNPSVLIDGEMLGAGDTVKGARVVKIERHAVTMEWQGQTNVLRLPQF